MKTNTMIIGALALLATGITSYAVGKTASQDAPMSAATKEHAWLAKHAGNYTATTSGMMGGAAAANRIDSVMGGLWNVSHFETTMMGQPFKGMEILGYDPEQKKFVSVWIDSMTPKLMTMEGEYDKESKTLTMRGISTGMDGEQAEMVNTTVFDDTGMTFSMSIEGMDEPVYIIDYDRAK
ncbi:MAG: DUF1579 family protein [Planctomycetota bacterium]